MAAGYLFHGPPGTGKTSMAQAAATRFQLNIYLVSLAQPGLNDSNLADMFERVPDSCIILIEDIDSAGIRRENMRAKDKKAEDDQDSANITLAGLLNIIDGPVSKTGRILIVSSNDPDSLDPALVRPGRIDVKIYLGNATTEVLMSMSKHMFAASPEQASVSAIAHLDDTRVDELALAFGAVIPSEKLSPAGIQGYLMSHRNDPLAAVWQAGHFADKIIAIKARGANVSVPSGERPNRGSPDPSSTESKGTSDGSANGSE